MIRSIRKFTWLLLAGGFLCVSSCAESKPAAPPPPPVTDTAPVGEGLKVVGFSLLGAAVVIALGRLAR